MPRTSSSQRLTYVARRVILSPLSAAIWIGAILISARTGWSPIPIGAAIALQGAALLMRLNDKTYLARLLADQDADETSFSDTEVEERLGAMDFETRQRIRYIIQLQKEIAREARSSDVQDYARSELDRIATRLPVLVNQAIRIASRKQQLGRYLHHVDDRALQAYAANLKTRIEATADPVARKQYEQALKAREAELATYQAIAQASGRIDSQLENVEATFASWKARVIRLKTVDIGDVSAFSEGLVQELETLGSEIDLLDTSVMEALTPEQPAIVEIGTGAKL